MNVLGLSLIISNQAGQSIDLYDDPSVALMSSDGLDYEGSVSTITQYGIDGGVYDNTTISPRNISLTLQYKYTIDDEAAKLRVHNIAVPKELLTITYITPHITRQIQGYCEKCTTPPNAYPMITTINIVCPDPWWTVPDSPEIVADIPGEIIYNGNIQNGFKTLINLQSKAHTITLTVNDKRFKLSTIYAPPFNWGDPLKPADEQYPVYPSGSKIEIDSRTGYKSVYCIIGSYKYERFVDVSPIYLFPVLNPGANTIDISCDGSFTATIEYVEKYRG